MLKKRTQVSLQPHNTFGLEVKAAELLELTSLEEAKEAARKGWLQSTVSLILGGGSNVLLTQNIKGCVVINRIEGIEVIDETTDWVQVRVGGGVEWHAFVLYCLDREWGGIENLSLIPGSVGAAPMQNIGAYGVELERNFVELEAVHRSTGEVHRFTKSACEFGYRTSIFKTTLRNRFLIARVTFQLTKNNHQLNTSYGAIQHHLSLEGITDPTIRDVSNAVIAIRESKLPNPKEIGNSGSFFKNPVVHKEKALKLKAHHPDLPIYPVDENHSKIAAGWLIEQAGWKGKDLGGYGVHKKQALVLVNYGSATGKQIYNLSSDIIEDVEQKFGITLEREVNVV